MKAFADLLLVHLLVALALCAGCMSISERATLADGTETSTRGLSFWSKTALPLADSSKELSASEYKRQTRLEGLDTDPETETVAAMSGMVGSVLGAQQGTITALIESRDREELQAELAAFTETLEVLRGEIAEIREAQETSPAPTE